MLSEKIPLHNRPVRQAAHKAPGLRSSESRKRLLLLLLLVMLTILSFRNIALITEKLEDVARIWLEPSEPLARAKYIMENVPLIDTHIDLPILIRARYANQPTKFNLSEPMLGHVDIPRLREGRVCTMRIKLGEDEGANLTKATWRVRDTLEQIDISRLLIDQYSSDFALALTPAAITGAFANNRIAALIGVEGGHQLGNSLSSLRMYYELGVRYITLTHTCNNAFADSAGMQGVPIDERHGGLSKLGKVLVAEMNRLGMMVDVSHTSAKTQHDALTHSLAPVIYSHSNAAPVYDVVRNVPASVLERIAGSSTSAPVRAGDALISVTFAPDFVSATGANISKIADHIEAIANLAGKQHVGIGSDFDGIMTVPDDLTDVAGYPKLIAELFIRGWTTREVEGLLSANLLRVMLKADEVAASLKAAGTPPATDLYEARDDLPMKF